MKFIEKITNVGKLLAFWKYLKKGDAQKKIEQEVKEEINSIKEIKGIK